MRLSRHVWVLLIAATTMAEATVLAQQIATASVPSDCPSEEPDSLQISWTQPCEEGDWLLDTTNGCRMADWHPDPKDRAEWSGRCAAGGKEGSGVVQWYEHGQPIDRFEGTFRNGKREGFGRYVWTAAASYEGHYANDVPDGAGTATVLGERFTGTWKNGCLAADGRVVAIGVERSACTVPLLAEHSAKPAL